MGRDARFAGGSGAQQGPHSPSGSRTRGERSRRAERSLRPRHRAEHAMVGELASPERLAADHRLVQQRCGRDGAGSGEWHPGARSLAPGHRALRRWRVQHADERISDRGASQATREGGGVQQRIVRAHPPGGRSQRTAGLQGGDRISQSGLRGAGTRVWCTRISRGTARRATRRDRAGAADCWPGPRRLRRGAE